MKLLHTSDWHLGMKYHNHSYASDQRHFINEIAEIAKSEEVDAVLIAGDIFDRSLTSAEAVKLYDEAMERLCLEQGLQVLIIAGNHDGADHLASCSELLKKSGLYISGTLGAECECVRFEDTDVYLLPWISIEWVKAFYEDAGDVDTLEDAYQIVCDAIRKSFKPGKNHILLSHAFITNAETSTSDKAAEVGFATQVGAKVFEDFDYVALGHIHKPQDVNERMRYSGTPMAYSFGAEEKQEKSVTIINTADMSKKIVTLNPLHKRISLKGTYDEIMSTEYEADVLEAYANIELTDTYPSMDTFYRINERFPNLLDLSGKSLNSDEGTITMSLDDFKKQENDPFAILDSYVSDNGGELTASVKELFKLAVDDYNKEVSNL